MALLTWIVFLPLLVGVVLLFVPKQQVELIRRTALAATIIDLALAIKLLMTYDPSNPALQVVERLSWIPPLNVWYHLGVDGLSVPLVFLTALLSCLACLGSWGIAQRHKEFFVLYLLLQTGMLGTFVAQDLFLFYVFWEVVLVPMYFLIGIWGGPNREYAAIKFFLYTLAGSVFMLLGIIALYFASTPHTFSIPELVAQGRSFAPHFQRVIFLAFFFGFAIKVPIFPFHTWLPDAHVEAPTPISVLLAGVLLKMGGYGFFRISMPMLPDAAQWAAPGLAVLGAISIVYGAFVAMAQTDFKKMVAYSSVSHMGFVMLGLASMTSSGVHGALLQMFNHGIITGGMFLLVGVLYDRAHTRDMGAFGGLGAKVPVYGGVLSMFSLASLGLPGLAGFVSEFLSLLGGFSRYPVITGICVLGIVITAAYTLIMLQRVLMGALNERWSRLADINVRELVTLVPLAIITVVVGLYPSVMLRLQDAAVQGLIAWIVGGPS